MLGADYATNAEPATFTTAANGRGRPQRPRAPSAAPGSLPPPRWSATPTSPRALVKQLTGGDAITARKLYQEPVHLPAPRSSCWLAVNDLPRVAGDSHAIWRRLRVIPFVGHDRAAPTQALPTKLRAELPGILAWAVRGCLGLAAPRARHLRRRRPGDRAPTAASRTASSVFLERLLRASTPTARVESGELLAAYRAWETRAHGARSR